MLDSKNHKPPFFNEGEVWWCCIGENIGVEIRGKGTQFTRPVYIFKKYDQNSFLALPLTSKVKVGTWYVEVVIAKKSQTILLAQGKVLSYKRLMQKIEKLDFTTREKITLAYELLHIKHKPLAVSGEGRG